MKNLFSNIKHIALSLLIVGLAIGTQSFINGEKSKFTTYYLTPSQDWDTQTQFTVSENPPGTCNGGEFVCSVESSAAPVGGLISKSTITDHTEYN